MHFASYYRWLVATRYWGLPQTFSTPVLDIGADDGLFLSAIESPYKVGIEHVEDDTALLREACRVLCPGGILWLSTTAVNFYLLPGHFIQRRFETSIGQAGHLFAKVTKE
jgi:hypothetical protein